MVAGPQFEPTSGGVGAGPRALPQTKSCVTCTETPGSRPLRPVEFEVQPCPPDRQSEILFIPEGAVQSSLFF
jgi:hypothetical protein